jgi:hypothetical protein
MIPIPQQPLPQHIINNEINRLNDSIEIQIKEAEDRLLNLLTFGLYGILNHTMEEQWK